MYTDEINKEAFTQGYRNIQVYMQCGSKDQIIRDLDWKTILPMEYFTEHIDFMEFDDNILYRLPYGSRQWDDLQDALADFFNGDLVYGIRHIDTQRNENYWRVQIHVDFRIFPAVVGLIRNDGIERPYRASYSGSTCVTLTFNLRYV